MTLDSLRTCTLINSAITVIAVITVQQIFQCHIITFQHCLLFSFRLFKKEREIETVSLKV